MWPVRGYNVTAGCKQHEHVNICTISQDYLFKRQQKVTWTRFMIFGFNESLLKLFSLHVNEAIHVFGARVTSGDL